MSAPPPPPTLPDLNSGSRNFITTPQDHGGIALTVSTLLVTWVVLCLFVRMYMRATVSGPFGLDDILCSVATVFAIVQTAASGAAISYGFGKALELLTPSQIESASKAVYAAELLYLVTNALSKCTIALLLARIVFVKSRVRACYGILAAAVVWGVAAFLAEAIRCTKYAPWKIVGQDQCSNQFLSWQVITAFNIIIEVILLAFPVWLVWDLQTNRQRKMVVVAFFWLRLPVIICAALRIHYLGATIYSPEPLLRGVIPFILLNIEMHYGLMAATMPTLKPFVSAFNTNWGTYDTTGRSGYGQNSSASYAMNSLERNNRSNNQNSKQNSHARSADREPPQFGKNVTHIRSAPPSDPSKKHSEESSESQQMIIRQTLTTEVHYEEEARRKELNSSRGYDSIENLHSTPNFSHPKQQ